MRCLKQVIALTLCLLVIPAWVFGLTYTTPSTTDGVVESDPPVGEVVPVSIIRVAADALIGRPL